MDDRRQPGGLIWLLALALAFALKRASVKSKAHLLHFPAGSSISQRGFAPLNPPKSRAKQEQKPCQISPFYGWEN